MPSRYRDEETAPLRPDEEDGFDGARSPVRKEAKALSNARLLALTGSIGGLQFVWSTLLSNVSLYLLSLGISKSASALILAAPPLCGTFVQPYIGILSDQSRNPYGRRRPFIIGGTISSIVFLALLAWCGVILHSRLWENMQAIHTLVVFILVLGLSVSIQPLQFGTRALILDVCPPSQQPIANAWAGRFTGAANIIGFFLGSLELPKAWPQTEASRFRMLTGITAVLLSLSVVVTCWFVDERKGMRARKKLVVKEKPSLVHHVKDLIATARMMPKGLRSICMVQFTIWMGWFVFLYYSSTYVAALYETKPHTKDEASAGAVGTRSSLVYAVVSLVTSILLPMIANYLQRITSPFTSNTDAKSHFSVRRSERLYKRFWIFGHLLFSACMLAVSFVRDDLVATVLIGVLGISWAITLWIPFTLLGIEITSQLKPPSSSSTSSSSSTLGDDRDHSGNDLLDGEDQDGESPVDAEDDLAGAEAEAVSHSGTILALHNAAISGPQIIAALGCSLLFWLLPNLDTRESIQVVFRLASVIGLYAAFLVFRS